MSEPEPYQVAAIPIGVLFEDQRVRVELLEGEVFEAARGMSPAYTELRVNYSAYADKPYGYLKAYWHNADGVKALVKGLVRTTGNEVLVHRLVAALSLGELLKHEVHHDNENGLDNRSANLLRVTKAEHNDIHAGRDRPALVFPGKFPGLKLRIAWLDRPGARELPRAPTGFATWPKCPGGPTPASPGATPEGLRSSHTGRRPLSGLDGLDDDEPDELLEDAQPDGAPIRRARQLGRFGFTGPAASWAALVLRVVASHEGATRRRAIEGVFVARCGSTRTLSNLLQRLRKEELLERTKRGRYILGAKAGA